MMETCERTFAATVDALDDVTAFLEARLEAYESTLRAQTQVLVAAEEIFVNIAHYAYPEGTGTARIGCAFDADTRVLRVTFADRGVPYNPLAHDDPDVTLSAEARDIGGLGILMVKKSMDRVTYAYVDGENVLTLEKTI